MLACYRIGGNDEVSITYWATIKKKDWTSGWLACDLTGNYRVEASSIKATWTASSIFSLHMLLLSPDVPFWQKPGSRNHTWTCIYCSFQYIFLREAIICEEEKIVWNNFSEVKLWSRISLGWDAFKGLVPTIQNTGCFLWLVPPEPPQRSEFLNLLRISEFFGFQWQNLEEILSLSKKYNNLRKVAVREKVWLIMHCEHLIDWMV